MQNLNLLETFTKPLQSVNISFIISGSVASIVYGDPRITHDIDLVLELSKYDIDKLVSVFPKNEFYLPPKEIITLEILRDNRGHFNIIHIASGFKCFYENTHHRRR